MLKVIFITVYTTDCSFGCVNAVTSSSNSINNNTLLFQETNTGAGFPAAVAQKLHSKVFADTWNIPYKRNEYLGQCILAAIRLVKESKE